MSHLRSTASIRHSRHCADPVPSTPSTDVNLISFRAYLERLRAVSTTPIRALTGSNLADYQYVVGIIQATYDTDTYLAVYRQITEVFQGVVPIPGTVGGYFAGCLNNNFPEAPTCSLTCVNAVPPPSGVKCDTLVVLADLTATGFVFTAVNHEVINNRSRAYVYVNYPTLNAFPGFTEVEKANLASIGVQSVALISLHQQNGQYVDLTGGFLPLADIRTRPPGPPPAPRPAGGNWGTLLIIIIIIIIIIWLIAAARRKSDCAC